MANPTMSAEERAATLKNEVAGLQQVRPEDWRYLFEQYALGQIRQAEQAAYERAARFAEKAGYGAWLAVEIRALAQEPEEVG